MYLIPATAFIGGFLAFGLMVGAIFSHLTVLGVESNGDGGTLFTLAIVVLILSVVIQVLHKSQGIALYEKYPKKTS